MWQLFLDDMRFPENNNWVVCRFSDEAIEKVKELGMPSTMALDYELGFHDNTLVFLNWLKNEFWDKKSPLPIYTVHSSSKYGCQAIDKFMSDWKQEIA